MSAMINLLLQNLGIKPEEIQKNISEAQQAFVNTVEHFNKRIDKLEQLIAGEDTDNRGGK